MDPMWKLRRRMKSEELSLKNRLLSIREDSHFVTLMQSRHPELPLFANLRNGLWYVPPDTPTCYFKSTDGHSNHWDFSLNRLNLRVAEEALKYGGCIIVDSTRKGKKFPDSLSKTIPIWCSVLNLVTQFNSKPNPPPPSSESRKDQKKSGEIVLNFSASQQKHPKMSSETRKDKKKGDFSRNKSGDEPSTANLRFGKDEEKKELIKKSALKPELHLPLWVAQTEGSVILGKIRPWARSLAETLPQTRMRLLVKSFSEGPPLRCIWACPGQIPWKQLDGPINLKNLNLNFTPIICVSVSRLESGGTDLLGKRRGWHYVQGAGDDDENWARGLTPSLFWKNIHKLLKPGIDPICCAEKAIQLVKDHKEEKRNSGQEFLEVLEVGSTGLGVVVLNGNSPDKQITALKNDLGYKYAILTLPREFKSEGETDGVLVVRICDDKRTENRMSLFNAIPKILKFVSRIYPPPSTSNPEKLVLIGVRGTASETRGKILGVCVCVATLILLQRNWYNSKFSLISKQPQPEPQTQQNVDKKRVKQALVLVKSFVPEE
ncbi:hypothetical protein AAMO2058_001412200 [Amorphochlora amoebiformis]